MWEGNEPRSEMTGVIVRCTPEHSANPRPANPEVARQVRLVLARAITQKLLVLRAKGVIVQLLPLQPDLLPW